MLNHNRVKRTDSAQTLAVTHIFAITVPCSALAALILLARAAQLTHQTLRVHTVNRPLRLLAAAPALPRRLEIIPLQHRRTPGTRRLIRHLGATFPAIRLHISRQSINFAPGNGRLTVGSN